MIYRSQTQSSDLHEQKLMRYENLGGGISDTARSFADEHWNRDIYLGYEFWLSENYQTADRQFDGNAEDWFRMEWEEKLERERKGSRRLVPFKCA